MYYISYPTGCSFTGGQLEHRHRPGGLPRPLGPADAPGPPALRRHVRHARVPPVAGQAGPLGGLPPRLDRGSRQGRPGQPARAVRAAGDPGHGRRARARGSGEVGPRSGA
ncbi:hypothetical protein Tdes44962_MAKER10523 [Teratosphaeria destructans]|uniref:Uncharacterized protein n=1 Tax=Teratosphaeria destructans TaxID=418781 RepID=A0A9W7SZ50_9PEZI|nr:hypothetical protein Tdes44962_MAKER10523 [Teratosphaeria destructans]